MLHWPNAVLYFSAELYFTNTILHGNQSTPFHLMSPMQNTLKCTSVMMAWNNSLWSDCCHGNIQQSLPWLYLCSNQPLLFDTFCINFGPIAFNNSAWHFSWQIFDTKGKSNTCNCLGAITTALNNKSFRDITIKSKEKRAVIYTSRYSSEHLIPDMTEL